MPPTEDCELQLRLLGQVQALSHDLENIQTRAQARALKAKLVELQRDSSREGVGRAVEQIVSAFISLSQATIVQSYGTAAWDEPDTTKQATTPMGKLPRGVDLPHPVIDGSLATLTDLELNDLRDFFNGLPDMAPIHEATAKQVTSALAELQRLRAKTRKLR